MQYKDKIKVTKSFLSENEMKFFRDYEDDILETKQDKIVVYNNGNRPVLQFGKDFDEVTRSHQSLEIVHEIEDVVRDLFVKVQDRAKELFEDSKDIYVCSFWFAKQLPGAFVMEHIDTDGGINTHFKYSAIIYLNTLKNTGQLIFTDLKHSYMPEAGDMILFKSTESGKHLVEPIDEDRYTLAMWITEDKSFAI